MQFLQVMLTLMVAVELTVAVPRPQTLDLSFTDSITTSVSSFEASDTLLSIAVPTATSLSDACAQLASLVSASTESFPIVPAKAAWKCLQAIPLDEATAEAWVETLRPYVRWQSTLAYLQDPPEGYTLPPYNIYSALDNITSRIQDGLFQNQYELEFVIYRAFQQAYDGHFSYQPNLVARIASFRRPFALVSVSSDGRAPPQPFVYADVLLSYMDTTFAPSAVVKIDGETAIDYLEKYSLNAQQHDADALWNSLFLELASVQLGAEGLGPGFFAGGGQGSFIYPNATTTLTFENGSTTTYKNVARLLVSFANITNAQDLYERYVNLPTLPTPASSTRDANATPLPGFPEPVMRSVYNLVGGYYLNGENYDDVAVLSLPSFQKYMGNTNVSYEFLDRAKSDGKTKLIIDLSANGGGAVSYGFELFLKLFPNLSPYLGTRFRASQTFDIVGQTVSDWSNGSSSIDSINPEDYYQYSIFFDGYTPFPYASDVDKEYEPFMDWTAKFGPREFDDDNFTSIIRWNLAQPAIGIDPNMFSESTQPLFESENIILLTDGYCASTCSNFVEFMTKQAGVKTVAVGGRPNNDSMQVVGGTRGSNNYSWLSIASFVNAAYTLINSTQGLLQATYLYLNTELGEYLGSIGSDPLAPFKRGGYTSSINVRDNIRNDDEAQIPLHFIYQAADCRIYWTVDMTVDITALWEMVADVGWGDGECVVGRIRNDTSLTAKRSKDERSDERRVRRRAIKDADLDALAKSLNIWTNHDTDMSGGAITLP